jgi:PadR family transcriptional regulator, regulatory protein PadR
VPSAGTECRRSQSQRAQPAVVGFDLVRTLAQADGLITSEGTIYPLLSRLRRDGLVTTTWHESSSGPPRRYYGLTPAGHQALELFTAEWDRFTNAVDRLLKQGEGS